MIGFGGGNRDDPAALKERRQLVDLLATGLDQLPRRRMLRLGARPRGERVGAVEAARQRPECLLRRLQLALGDREQALDGNADSFLELQLLLELLAAEPE